MSGSGTPGSRLELLRPQPPSAGAFLMRSLLSRTVWSLSLVLMCPLRMCLVAAPYGADTRQMKQSRSSEQRRIINVIAGKLLLLPARVPQRATLGATPIWGFSPIDQYLEPKLHPREPTHRKSLNVRIDMKPPA